MFGFFNSEFNLPVADIQGSKPGPTLLVTAGVDGDEYAPIEAAYAAAEKYRHGNFVGRLIILPIINMAGFDAGTSENPIDGKYPKYCIPGRLFGTSSQRLIHSIVKTYVHRVTLWVDLHSGALDEIAIPCAWNDITGTTEVDMRGEAFINHAGLVAAVREPAGKASKTLANYGCTYVLAESEDEQQHMHYIDVAMHTLGMISENFPALPPRIFGGSRKIHSLAEIKEHEVLLWQKIGGAIGKDGYVGEIACDEQKG